METQPQPQEIQTVEEFTPNMRALIFGNNTHTPTDLQTKLIYEYINDPEGLTPPQLLRKLGYAPHNWWLWPKRHPGFLKWWNDIVAHVFAKHRMNDIYNALYRRGMVADTAALKLLMQRFDPEFTERQQVDQRHSFAGYEPQGPARSEERQRKALVDHALGLPEAALDARVGADTPTTPATEALTGGAPLSPPSTPAIQAQSPSNTDEPEPASHDDNDDDTPNSKPITPIDGAGGGL